MQSNVNQTEFKEINELKTKGFNRVPISREIPIENTSTLDVLKKLKERSTSVFLLENLKNHKDEGRYTYLGFKPDGKFICKAGKLSYQYRNDKKYTQQVSHPSSFINELLNKYRSPKLDQLPPFSGGLVGYFSYSYMQYSEPSLHLSSETSEFPDLELLLFNEVIVFDHFKDKIILISGVYTDTYDAEIEINYSNAIVKLAKMEEIIRSTEKLNFYPFSMDNIRPIFSQDEFESIVNKTKEYIGSKEIKQVVVANTQQGKTEGSLLNVYQVLKQTNPSPYTYYFCYQDTEIVGASPETLVKLEKFKLSTYPLAGTRPRGETEEKDLLLEKELLKDRKELSEHNMLVELSKEDLLKISERDTVTVEEYLNIIHYSHVMHLGSVVQSQLKKGLTPMNVIDTMLPAGTLSGSPKVRATEIIQEVEGKERGIYGGAIGYIDFSGDLDLGISIRLAYQKNQQVYVQAGAGIVKDSNPKNEYFESINKAKAVIEALEKANKIKY